MLSKSISTINSEFYSELLSLASVKCKTQQQVKLFSLISGRSHISGALFLSIRKENGKSLGSGRYLVMLDLFGS
jgi:hypothetical protein